MLNPFKVKKLINWAFYDFANSSYVLIYQAFLLPVYFTTVLVTFGFDKASWGLANGLSTLIGLFFAIIAGSYSDKSDRLRIFKVLIYLSALGMLLVSFLVWILPPAVFYIYIITNSFFIATISLSDSLLTFIADKGKTNEFSGFAWGWGYLGGIVCLFGVMAIQAFTNEFSPLTFAFVGLFYLGISLFVLRGLGASKEIFRAEKQNIAEKKKITPINKLLLLIGYWLISESITVIILFFSIYASQELKLDSQKIGLILLVVQIIGIVTTWFGGRLADKYNTLTLLGLSIAGWIIVILLLVFAANFTGLIFVTILTGLVIGNSQSYLRSQFAQIVNKYEAGFQFGLFSVASQAAVVVGPILHGYLSDYLGSQKTPMLIMIFFLVIGFVVILISLNRINKSEELNLIEARN